MTQKAKSMSQKVLFFVPMGLNLHAPDVVEFRNTIQQWSRYMRLINFHNPIGPASDVRDKQRHRHTYLIERSLEVKPPTIWTDEAAEVGRGREEKEPGEKKSEKRKSQQKEGRSKGAKN